MKKFPRQRNSSSADLKLANLYNMMISTFHQMRTVKLTMVTTAHDSKIKIFFLMIKTKSIMNNICTKRIINKTE